MKVISETRREHCYLISTFLLFLTK